MVLPGLLEHVFKHGHTLACLVAYNGGRECVVLSRPFGDTTAPEAEYASWLQVDLLFGNEVEEAAQVFRDVPKVEAVIPVAAAKGQNVKAVEDWAVSHLPLGPALYPKVQPNWQPSRDTSSIASTSWHAPCQRLGLAAGSLVAEPLIAGGIHQEQQPVTTPAIAGHCQRTSRALLRGRDHPRKGVPAISRGDTLLHYSASRPSALQCLAAKALTVAEGTRAGVLNFVPLCELWSVWSPGADQ